MIAALILAGGNGTRLGGADKALVELNGRKLIHHLLARLGPQVAKIAISANGDATRFDAFALDVLPDGPLAGIGPLAGLAAGLAWAERQGAESLVTVPVDTPFIPPDLVARLTPAPSVAVYRGRRHHLVAHWPASGRAALAHFLQTRLQTGMQTGVQTGAPYRVRDFLASCAAREVAFEAPEDPFLNINTPEDFTRAMARR